MAARGVRAEGHVPDRLGRAGYVPSHARSPDEELPLAVDRANDRVGHRRDELERHARYGHSTGQVHLDGRVVDERPGIARAIERETSSAGIERKVPGIGIEVNVVPGDRDTRATRATRSRRPRRRGRPQAARRSDVPASHRSPPDPRERSGPQEESGRAANRQASQQGETKLRQYQQ